MAGVHRFFYNGGRYVYCVGNKPGFLTFILRIIDIQDPTHPVEVGHGGQIINTVLINLVVVMLPLVQKSS